MELWKIRAFYGRTADTYSCVHQVTKGGKVLEMPQLSLPKPSLTAAAAFTPSSEKISVTLPVVPISTNWSFLTGSPNYLITPNPALLSNPQIPGELKI